MLSAEVRLGVLAFIVGVIFWPGTVGAPSMPRWAAIAVGLPLVSTLDPRSVPAWARIVFVSALAYAAIVTAWSPRPWGGYFDIFCIALMGLTALGAAGCRDRTPALLGLCAAAALSGILGILQYAGVFKAVPHSGIAGLFLNSEVLAELLAPLLVWALWKRRFALAALLATPLVLGDSRIAVGAVLFGLWWGWTPRHRWIKGVALAVIAVAAVAALLLVKGQSTGMRFVLWGTAILSMTPTGLGLGWWGAAHPFPWEDYVHSDVLQAFVEMGPAAILFLAFPAWLLWRRDGNVAEQSAFAAVVAEAFVSFPLHVPATAFLAALLAGGLAGDRHRVRRFDGGIADAGVDAAGRQFAFSRAMAGGGRCHGDGVPVRSEPSEPARLYPARRSGSGG